MWTYVSSDIKGHFVFPNCQFRKRWFGPQQAKSKSWLWSLRHFLSLSFTTKCHRCHSVKWENIALAVQKLVNICMVKTYILSVDWHLPFYFLKYPGNLDKVQKNSSFSSRDRPYGRHKILMAGKRKVDQERHVTCVMTREVDWYTPTRDMDRNIQNSK